MEKIEVTRREIEEKLKNVGDYVKIDYLAAALKKQLDFDTRRFVLTRLSALYESKNMFLEAGKLIRAAADINTTYEAKMNDFVKSAELFIKSGNFAEVDISVTKAIAVANERQKVDVKMKVKEAYKMHAQEAMKRDKRKQAMDVYEKLLTLDLMPNERKEMQTTLLELYQKLGKIREYSNLQKSMNGPSITQIREQVNSSPTSPNNRPREREAPTRKNPDLDIDWY